MFCNFLLLFYSRRSFVLTGCSPRLHRCSQRQQVTRAARGRAGKLPPSTVSGLFRKVTRPPLTKAKSRCGRKPVPPSSVISAQLQSIGKWTAAFISPAVFNSGSWAFSLFFLTALWHCSFLAPRPPLWTTSVAALSSDLSADPRQPWTTFSRYNCV